MANLPRLDTQFSRFVKVANWLFNKLLAPEDKVSLHTCKKLLQSSPLLYRSMTRKLSEGAAAELMFVAINLGNVVYQFGYASWFSVLLTSVSGLKKLFSVVIHDPVLGIFFYLSFYFRLLSESDIEKFDAVADAFNLPLHEDFVGSAFTAAMVNNVVALIPGMEEPGYGMFLDNIIQKVFMEQVVAKSVEAVPNLVSALTAVFQSPKLSAELPKSVAVDVGDSLAEEYNVQELKTFLKENGDAIKKRVKAEYRNSKRRQREELQHSLEQLDSKGNVKCMTPCKNQVKTRMGCYCDGECGATLKWGKKQWCYVDPSKCKRGKYLPHFLGRTYDFCDSTNTTANTKCYTGARYMDCKK